MQSPEVYVIVAEQLQPGFAGGFHQKLSHNFGLAILGAAWQHYQAKIPALYDDRTRGPLAVYRKPSLFP